MAVSLIHFRITDADHDLDMETVQVFNCSLETCEPGQPALTPYRGHYWWNQWHSDGGDYGWFIAEVPLTTADAGLNELAICASDAAGNPLGTPTDPCVTATVTRESPLVYALITEPAEIPYTAPPGAVVQLDGSSSAMPDGGVALWTTGVKTNYLGSPWAQLSATEPTPNLDDLETITLMPYGGYDTFRARLVVAASPDDLPSELWPENGSLPCVRWGGDGRCDSVDVIFDPSCGVEFLTAQVVMDEPAAPPNVGANDTVHLAAHVASPNLEPFAFRWLVYRNVGGGQKWLVTTIGADDEGEGFSIDNNDLLITPAGQGLGPGNYVLLCRGPLPGLRLRRPGLVPRQLQREESHGRPHPRRRGARQVVEGGTFRVYSRTWTAGRRRLRLHRRRPRRCDRSHDLLRHRPARRLPRDHPRPGRAAGDRRRVVRQRRLTTSTAPGAAPGSTPSASSPPATPRARSSSTNEEDTSCGGAGTECAHPILPGQTWQGEWGEAGDADYFSFIAGAGDRGQRSPSSAST